MSAPLIKGWCPGTRRPMLSGDGWIIRVRPPLGRLTQAAARNVAELATKHGNGLIDLTARASLQIRGVREDRIAAVAAGLDALDLIDPDAGAEARNTVVVSPFWQQGDEAQTIAAELSQALRAHDAPDLPGKFGFAVDLGPKPVLRDISADIRIERDDSGGIVCCADGATTGTPVTAAAVTETALALARWFVASSGLRDGRGRMRAHLQSGAALPDAFLAKGCQGAITWRPVPGAVTEGFLAAIAFGQLRARTLANVAELAPLRLTPWRMLLMEGCDVAPDDADLITASDDPLLRVVACTGAPGCPQARQPTRALAAALAPGIPAGALAHVSGCTKGCAHPGVAAWTFVGTARGFDLVRNGSAADTAAVRGLVPEASILSGFF